MKIIGKPEETEGEKRVYLPGVSVQGTCPECGRVITEDLDIHYLSYPAINAAAPSDYTFYCEDDGGCGHEWTEEYHLRMTIEPAKQGQ